MILGKIVLEIESRAGERYCMLHMYGPWNFIGFSGSMLSHKSLHLLDVKSSYCAYDQKLLMALKDCRVLEHIHMLRWSEDSLLCWRTFCGTILKRIAYTSKSTSHLAILNCNLLTSRWFNELKFDETILAVLFFKLKTHFSEGG